ncbi:hypothetical protein MKX01_042018 [Papaver californicum]|nr:hypothetical protein MKX01_042018 [Papaver californicum]
MFFFKQISRSSQVSSPNRPSKISVIGTGNVGMTIAQTILTQDIADEIALVDALPDKLHGEMLDLQHVAVFLPRTKIAASVDYGVTSGSDLCIVTAGAHQIPGESRLNLVHRNLNLFQKIIPQIAKYSPHTILLIVFRFLIADHLDFNAQDVQAYILGEHGDTSVALWSSISIGGVPVLSFLEKQQIAYEKHTLEKIHKVVIDGAYEVINLKGYTSWAIGYSAASLAKVLLRDQRKIQPVSVLAKGFYGIDGGDVFLSLHAQLGRDGVLGVIYLHLNDGERLRLQESAKTILEIQTQLGI